jgi:hypothetical protein
MDEDLLARLNVMSERLHRRSLDLAHPDRDHDLSEMMQALAVTMEAVRSIGVAVNRLDGVRGFGRDGE